MRLDLATFLLQWAGGGLLFLWVTTRHRQVGLGYGWLLRSVYGLLAIGAAVTYVLQADGGVAQVVAVTSSIGVALGATVALVTSVVRRGAGVRGATATRDRRRARVAAMLDGDGDGDGEVGGDGKGDPGAPVGDRSEFPPALDLVAPLAAGVGLLAAASLAGGPGALAAARLLVGAAFLGAVTDAMLLGHWYLVQPGLRRDPVRELTRWVAILWPFQVGVFLWPTGMVQVLDGTIDDGWGGLLGWIWVACAVATIALVGVTWAALRERYYSAVMAATGLLYLAILTAFGTDLVARAVLA